MNFFKWAFSRKAPDWVALIVLMSLLTIWVVAMLIAIALQTMAGVLGIAVLPALIGLVCAVKTYKGN